MGDTRGKKVSSQYSPQGEMGPKYLASGTRVSMRLWEDEQPGEAKAPSVRDYETVGYVIKGRAELHLEVQLILLSQGDSWDLQNPGAVHRHRSDQPARAGLRPR